MRNIIAACGNDSELVQDLCQKNMSLLILLSLGKISVAETITQNTMV